MALHFLYYNFVRVLQTLRMTPAMAAGVTKRLWEMGDIVDMLEAWEAVQATGAGMLTRLRITILSALLATILLAFAPPLSSSQETQAQEQDETAQPETGDEAPEQAVALFVAFITWLGNRTGTQIAAFATVVIAVFTGGVMVVGIRQFQDSRILQRAYIAVEPLGIHPMANHRSVAHISVLNAGRLPARHVEWFVTYTFGPRRIPVLPPLEVRELRAECKLRGDNILVPGAGMRQGSSLVKYPAEITDDDGFLYVYGVVIYHDGFRAGRETRFCHRYNMANAVFDRVTEQNGPTISADDARHYHEGNSAT